MRDRNTAAVKMKLIKLLQENKTVWSVTHVSPPAQTVKEERKYMESPPALSNQERDVKLKIMKNRTAALSLQIQNNP